MEKKLYKSNDKVFAGVLGGVGEYFDIDPTILRLAYILLAIMTGVFPAIIGYIIAAIVVPQKPLVHHMDYTEPKKEPVKETPPVEKQEEKAEEKKDEPTQTI